VTLSNGPQAWTLEMGAGSLQEWLFTITYPSTGALYPISGLTWEYVARTTPVSSGTLISVTPSANTQGVLTVGTATSTVLLTLYPAATASLAPGQYSHALWSNPGSASTAYTWLAGNLIVAGNPQP
jgi:hypothetical protein